MGHHADDVALAEAALAGEAPALARLDRLIITEATAAAKRLDRSDAFASEVQQAVRVRLLVGDPSHARLADYEGRGPLGAWLGVVALRVALNLKRGERRVETDILDERLAATADPTLQLQRVQYQAAFRRALEAALAALPDRSRAVLRLVYVDGLRLVELGRLYGVHETTAARWVKGATADVADRVRERVAADLSVSPGSVDSAARLLLSQLDLSIARVLGA